MIRSIFREVREKYSSFRRLISRKMCDYVYNGFRNEAKFNIPNEGKKIVNKQVVKFISIVRLNIHAVRE